MELAAGIVLIVCIAIAILYRALTASQRGEGSAGVEFGDGDSGDGGGGDGGD